MKSPKCRTSQVDLLCCSLLQCVAEIHKTPTLPPQRSHLSVACLRLTFFVAVCCSLLHCVAKILKTPILPPQRRNACVARPRFTLYVVVCCSVLQNFSKCHHYHLSEVTGFCTSQVDVMCCSALKNVSEILKTPTALPTQRSDTIVICLR